MSESTWKSSILAGSIKGPLEACDPRPNMRLVCMIVFYSSSVLLHGQKHGEGKELALTRSFLEQSMK